MKIIFGLMMLLIAAPVYAGETSLPMLVTDTDPKGTNVRDQPSGKVVAVIPFGGQTDEEREKRAVVVIGQNKQWLKVRLSDNAVGWMHHSVLGTCASGSEDGNPHLYKDPNDKAPSVAELKGGTPVDLLEVKGNWAKVKTTGAQGQEISGWLPEQSMFSNALNDCRDPGSQINIVKTLTIINELPVAIKKITCDGPGEPTVIAADLASGQTKVEKNRDNYPDCNRAIIFNDDGQAWQFQIEPAVFSALTFSHDSVNSNLESKSPRLLTRLGDESYASPAGLDLQMLEFEMKNGLDEDKWREMMVPGSETLKDPGAFVVSLADTSWSLTGEGLVFKELRPGRKDASSITLKAAFGNTTIANLLEYLKNNSYDPWLFEEGGKATAFTDDGLKLNPAAQRVAALNTTDDRWAAAEKSVIALADSEAQMAKLVAGNESLSFELILNLAQSEAQVCLTHQGDWPQE